MILCSSYPCALQSASFMLPPHSSICHAYSRSLRSLAAFLACDHQVEESAEADVAGGAGYEDFLAVMVCERSEVAAMVM
jgi:hypothetical protein